MIDVERLRAAMDGYVGHDSWRCDWPDKGEPKCDFTMEAENIAAEYNADVPPLRFQGDPLYGNAKLLLERDA